MLPEKETEMASFKVRRKALLKGGEQIGSNGTVVNLLLHGTVSACVPAMSAACGVGTGSMAIANVPVGAKIFFSGSLTNGVHIYAASVNSLGNITASYMSASGATIASTLAFNYLAVA